MNMKSPTGILKLSISTVSTREDLILKKRQQIGYTASYRYVRYNVDQL